MSAVSEVAAEPLRRTRRRVSSVRVLPNGIDLSALGPRGQAVPGPLRPRDCQRLARRKRPLLRSSSSSTARRQVAGRGASA